MIQISGLTKEYGHRKVLDGLDLSIADGEAFGLLGPNGAGKTTIINCVCGLVRASGGDISIQDTRVGSARDIQDSVGLAPQEISLIPRLTARENLIFFGRLKGMEGQRASERARELLDWIGLIPDADRQVGEYSRGMMQRVNIAISLMHDPALLVLDEPTAGLDSEARALIWTLLRSLRAENRTVLMATHDLEEAEHLCDRLAVIKAGALKAVGTPDEIRRLAGHEVLRLVPHPGRRDDLERLARAQGIEVFYSGDVAVLKGPELRAKLRVVLDELGDGFSGLTYGQASFEDAFLSIVGDD
ncbi:MAG: ABC transporter ATP-binding protein [Candidatus Geothermincolia bacterium]